MSKIESYAPGSFCWAELASSDPDGAKKFYSAMFGWSWFDTPNPQGVYTTWEAEGNAAGALYGQKPGMPSYWGIYFSVISADDAAAKVSELGGKVVAGPFDVMEHGRMAIVQDPQGVTFCLWQAKAHIGATHGGPLNKVVWPELHTTDVPSAVAFYSGLFGWKTRPETDVESAQYLEWINGAEPMGGLMAMKSEQQGVPPHWMVYITVADCDERAAKAAELGAKICVPPMDIPNVGRFSVISDAQGATFSLIQMRPMHRPMGA